MRRGPDARARQDQLPDWGVWGVAYALGKLVGAGLRGSAPSTLLRTGILPNKKRAHGSFRALFDNFALNFTLPTGPPTLLATDLPPLRSC